MRKALPTRTLTIASCARVRRLTAAPLTLPIVLAIALCEWSARSARADADTSQILILNSYHPGYPWTDELMEAILESFRQVDPASQPFVEYLDCKHFPDFRHTETLAAFYRQKYADRRITAVITTDNPALEFALRYRAGLFEDIPIIFCGINGFEPEMLAGQPEVTGVAEMLDVGGTIRIALGLHPQAKEIVVIHDYTVTGLSTRHELEAVMPQFRDRVSFRFIDDLPMGEILSQIGKLNSDRLALVLSFVADRNGRVFPQATSTELLSRHCPVPLYGVHKLRLGFGIVGGSLLDARLHGQRVAEMALRVLAGTDPSQVPVKLDSTSRPMFDYSRLQRFGVSVSALPPDSIIVNQPKSFYRQYKHVVIPAAVIIVVLAALVCCLLLYILTRRRAEQRRQELIGQLEGKNAELERFAYTISHDLRSPLVTIMGFLGMLERDAIGGRTDSMKSDIQFISDAAGRMDAMLRELLEFSRIGRVASPQSDVPLAEVAAEAASLVAGPIAERGAHVAISDDLPVVRGDRRRLLQVFQNLIENAVKFMGDQPKPRIEIGLRKEGDREICYVRDNGEGLDPRYREKAFGLFERLNTDTDGTGVGLAIAKRIIEFHGGRIWIETEGLGKGCTVSFTLAGRTRQAMAAAR